MSKAEQKSPQVKRYGQLGGKLTPAERSKWRARWRDERSGTPRKIVRARKRTAFKAACAQANELGRILFSRNDALALFGTLSRLG